MTIQTGSIDYEKLVGYKNLDPFKKLCLEAGVRTSKAFRHPYITEVFESRGESAHVMRFGQMPKPFEIASVIEGLGNKDISADMFTLQCVAQQISIPGGGTYYDAIGQDNLAMIVNDLITTGALPYQVFMYMAVGDSGWFENEQRNIDLVNGFANGCIKCDAVWGGGETPTLRYIIKPEAADLAGSANGLIYPATNRIDPSRISHDDAIVVLYSSGPHSNGVSATIELAKVLPKGYATKLNSGKMFGEALLSPTHLYVPFMKTLLMHDIVPHYAINITGHGWKKIMRANQMFEYVITQMPKRHEVFDFLKAELGHSEKKMHEVFNMSGGFAVIVPQSQKQRTIEIAGYTGFSAIDAGYVREASAKRVILEPVNVEYAAEELDIR